MFWSGGGDNGCRRGCCCREDNACDCGRFHGEQIIGNEIFRKRKKKEEEDPASAFRRHQVPDHERSGKLPSERGVHVGNELHPDYRQDILSYLMISIEA